MGGVGLGIGLELRGSIALGINSVNRVKNRIRVSVLLFLRNTPPPSQKQIKVLLWANSFMPK